MNTYADFESIPDITKDIDGIQETQQYSVTVEHNWSINDINNLIQSKLPGEKIESEQFSYNPNNTVEPTSTKDKGSTSSPLPALPSISTSTPVSYQEEILCDYFLNNSLWRLEINRSTSDENYLSVNIHLLHNLIDNSAASSQQQLENFRSLRTSLIFKLRVFLFNADMNEAYARDTIEIKFDIGHFFASLLSPTDYEMRESRTNSNDDMGSMTRVVERFTLEKFCKTKDLLSWLDERNSSDFSLLSEFKIYNQTTDRDSSAGQNFDTKSRLRTKLNMFRKGGQEQEPKSPSSSSYSSTSSSSSASPSPPPLEEHHQTTTTDVTSAANSVLILSHKHAWTIKNWRHFLVSDARSHTFMNDSDISSVFANLNLDRRLSGEREGDRLNGNLTCMDNTDETSAIQLGRFRSKLFKLASNCEDQEPAETSTGTSSQSDMTPEIERLLKDVKWKLQLYPNGYSQEYEQNMSLFVNFSQLSGDLAQFSQPVARKKGGHLNIRDLKVNNSKVIEEKFYDQDPNSGLILLIKSPGALLSNTLDKVNAAIDDGDFSALNEAASDLVEKSRKRNKKLANLYETFVKASFQISILDANGRKVDKCQSEKQLFELFGSWGYKEYMPARDLVNARDKYLSDDFSTLNLHCKIVLYYTVTVKTKPSYEVDMNVESDGVGVMPWSDGKLTASSSSDNEPKSEASTSYDLPAIAEPPPTTTNKRKQHNMSNNSNNNNNKHINNKFSAPIKECNTLLYDLRRILKQSDMYDTIIRAPTSTSIDFIDLSDKSTYKEFKVHKLILSIRSEVFEKMLEFNDRTGADSYLDIIDSDAFTVQVFLNYLYTDTLEFDFKDQLKKQRSSSSHTKSDLNTELYTHLFIELFKISDKYCVHRLKQICEMQLLKLINVESTVELLILGYMHNSNKLKRKCFKSLAENLPLIVSQPAWNHLEKNYPALLAEAFRVLYLKQNQ